jgi:predicted nucleotidyltransferase
MGIEPLLTYHREQILELAARHGARNVRVFGSVARGEARPDSDIDFLVERGPNTSPFFPGGLLMDLQDLLGRRVDIVTEGGLHAALRDRVLREAVQL